MTDAVVDDIMAVLPPLLQSLEALSYVARYLNPPDFDRIMSDVGTPDQALQAACAQLTAWPEEFSDARVAPLPFWRWQPAFTPISASASC
ncbi:MULTISPECIES: hypothetical protein [unclassified Bradyrhizobium]|uniref:hypothetical protein n=1 Tax=unclassified Bradyrhizobium TaxID=2631580 RepID=UPI002916FE43|nr:MULTISPECIES: hypothetical protein [unclassified Bradyrhizobium]